MLLDPVMPEATLAAAMARALGVAYGPSDLEGVPSDDEDALDYFVGAASPSGVLASMLPPPKRSDSTLPDQGALTCSLTRNEDCVHGVPANPPITAVAMEVDNGAQWSTALQRPLSSPRELRVAGKRRRLNDVVDEDQRELAELLQLIDEDGLVPSHCAQVIHGQRHPGLRPLRVCVQAHIIFGACGCGLPFASRLAAATTRKRVLAF